MALLETWARGTVEVLPCPFCGAEPQWRHQGNEHTKSRRLVIHCPECRVERVNGAIRNDFAWLERISVEQWNRRATSGVALPDGGKTT
jgi:hypothetical protein